ncbi:MAG: hypothetical protein R3C53_06235 [Pirellulaceae bacterium]
MSRPASVRPWSSWLQLTAIVASLIFAWLVVLPWMATWPAVDRHIKRMERKNIAVDAMFYTELNWNPPDGAAWR